MKRELRIVFMGTPEFAVQTLEQLIDNDFNVVGVVTSPDKPSGRGQKMNSSSVKKYALEQGLPVLQPAKLRNEKFNEALRALEPNLQIVVAFRMLPEIVWQLPEYGTFNLHASLLPQYRGAAPINWSIINGETKTGVTTFFIDDKIDTGALILQKEVEIAADETAGSLHDKLKTVGAELVVETVGLIESGSVKTTKQEETNELKPAPKLNKDNCKIDWALAPYRIYNTIRGLSPYPAAWTYIENGAEKLTVKIFAGEYIKEAHDAPIGSLHTTKNELRVAVQNGWIRIDEIQLPGKRKMEAKALLNGYRFETDAKVL